MAESRPRVLVALHGAEPGRALAAFLGARGFDTVSVRDTEAALNALERERMDCLVCEARGPRLDGLAVLGLALADPAAMCSGMGATAAQSSLHPHAVRRSRSHYLSEHLYL